MGGGSLYMRLVALDFASESLMRVGYVVHRVATDTRSAGRQMRQEWEQDRLAVDALTRRIQEDAEKQALAWKRTLAANEIAYEREKRNFAELVAFQEAELAKLNRNPGLAVIHQQRIKDLEDSKAYYAQLFAQSEAYYKGEMNRAKENIVAIEQNAQQRIAWTNAWSANSKQRIEEARQSWDNLRGSMLASGMAVGMAGVGIMAVTGGIAYGMIHAAESASQFTSDMLLLVNHAHLAKDVLPQVTQDLLNMAPAVGFGPDALAQAFYHVQSALTSLPAPLQNVAGEEEVLTQAAHLAKVGHADLTDTVNAMISVLDSYRGMNLTASQAAGILNTTIGEGNMKMQDLANALKNGLAPVAAESGVKFASLGAALATLTDLGIPASRAATYLRSAIIQMTMPSGPAAKALEAIGLGADEAKKMVGGFSQVLADAGINQTAVAAKLRETGSLADTMDWLKQKLDAAGIHGEEAAALLGRAFGGIRSGTGVVSLVDNLSGLQQKEKDATDAARDFNSVWNYFNQNDPNQAIQKLFAGLQTLEVVLGRDLIPIMLQLIGAIDPWITQITKWVEQNKAIVQTLAPVLIIGGAVLGLLLTLGGAFGLLVGGLMSLVSALPVMLALLGGATIVFGGIAFIALEIHRHWAQVADFWSKTAIPVIANLHGTANELWVALQTASKVIIPGLESVLRDLWDQFNEGRGPLGAIRDLFVDGSRKLQEWVRSKNFADLVAWFAVYIPAGLKVLVDWFAVMFDQARLVFDGIAGIVKVQGDIMRNDWKSAAQDISSTWKTTSDDLTRVTRDQQQENEDSTTLFSSKLQQQYKDLTDSIYQSVNHSYNAQAATVDQKTDEMNAIVEDKSQRMKGNAHKLGKDMADGMAQGVDDGAGVFAAAVQRIVQTGLQAGRDTAQSKSPSRLFAEKLGITLPQGVAMGIQQGLPDIEAAAPAMVGAAMVSNQKITSSSVVANHNAKVVDQEHNQKVEDLLEQIKEAAEKDAKAAEAIASVLSRYTGRAGTLSAQAASRRTGTTP